MSSQSDRDSNKNEASSDKQHYPTLKRPSKMNKPIDKDITVTMPAQANDPSEILWNTTTNTASDSWQRAFTPSDGPRKDIFAPKKDKPKSLLKTETHFQGPSRQSKGSLDIKLDRDFTMKMNLSTQSLDSSTLFELMSGSANKLPKNKNYASTGSIDIKLNRQPSKPIQSSGSVCSEVKPAESAKPRMSRKSHSSRNLNEPKEDDRRRRRAHSVRDLKEKDGSTRAKAGESQSLHLRRLGNKTHSSLTTSSSASPKLKSPRKSIASTRQLEIGAGGEVVAVVRKAPTLEGQEARKTIVVRRKGEGGETDNRINKRQSSRRIRQSSVRHKKEGSAKDDLEQKQSPERHIPLRAPSGGADLLLSAASAKDDDIQRDSKSSNVGTVGTADDLTDSEQGAEVELSPRNDTSHSRSAPSIDNQRSPRPKVRHRVRVTEMRQLGKQNARQIFMTAGKGGLPLSGDDGVELSDESSMSEGPSKPPAQFEIALEPLNNQSPTTTRPELVNHNGGVSKRFISVTKSPFKVAGKLFKKAQSTAVGETEYSLPGDLPLGDDAQGGTRTAIKTIEAIGITSDQLEMLKKAGLRITPS